MASTCPSCHADNPDTVKFCGECGTKLDGSYTRTLEMPAAELARGALFAGRYEIIEELGVGGMGRVYRAHDTKLDEEVALKLIKPEIAADGRIAERFRNEIRVARRIAHPNVCRVHDLGEDGQTLYLTMEYVRGEDLKSLIHRVKALTVGASLGVARQVAEGLAAAQKLGIVHRDLKPANIMIDRNGNAKIMDFGIARVAQEKGVTGDGAVIGTPEYMSPEQVEGEEADPRSDIYALGVILFEMLTGRAPFEGATPFAVAVKHKTESPPSPRELVPQVPEGLNRLVLRCLEKDRDKRYQTAEELAADLAELERALPATDRVAPRARTRISREVTVKFAPKKALVAVLAFIAVVAAAVVTWRLLPHRKPGPAPSISGQPVLAVLYFENRSGDPKLDFWRNALPELLITTLQQSKYLQVVSGDEMLTALRKLGLAAAPEYSSEDIAKVAAQTGASHVLRGSFIKAGETIVITATLQKQGAGEAPTALRLEAASDKDVIVEADELVRRIKEGLDLTAPQLADDSEQFAGRITTSSPEALRYFVEGQTAVREFNTVAAVGFLEKAVEIDPGFAMAYRALAAAHGNLGHRAEMRKYLTKALELSSRLPENERLLIEGQVLSSDEDYVRSMEALEKLVKDYPRHSLGQAALAGVYRRSGNLDKAIEYLELALRTQKGTIFVTNLALCYSLKGLYAKAEDLCRSSLQGQEDNVAIRSELMYSLMGQGKLDLALAEAERIAILDPSLELLGGDVRLLQGDLDGAERVYRRVLEKDRPGGRIRLLYLALARGRFKDAVDLGRQNLQEAKGNVDLEAEAQRILALALEKAGSFADAGGAYDRYLELSALSRKTVAQPGLPYLPSQQENDLFVKGRIQAEMGSFAEAEKTAGEIVALVDRGINRQRLRWPEYIRGGVELGKGNDRKAAELYGQACGRLDADAGYLGIERLRNVIELDQATYFDGQARSLYGSGDLERAGQAFEKITQLTYGRLRHGDLYARALYMLGKIAERREDPVKARESYRTFLDLWKNADAGLPEVADAKARLAAF